MTNPAFTQLTFRGRNDDGSESGATWKATQGTDWTQDTGLNFRVRFRIDETNSRAWTNKVWNLYYQKNAGGYSAVTDSTPVKFSLSSNFVDGADCTTQLTGGSGTFVTDNNGMKEASGGATNSGTADYLFEVEFCLQLDAAQLVTNDTINLRIYDGSAAIAAYTDTPVITANVTSQNINETSTLAVSNKTIAALSEVSGQDSTTLAVSNKTIVALSEVSDQDLTTLAVSNKTIGAATDISGQDASIINIYQNITLLEFRVVEETLYGA
jgi:hypothetical protein